MTVTAFTQKITASEGGRISSPTQSMTVQVPTAVYFKLDLIDDSTRDDPFARIKRGLSPEIDQLEPGHTYWLSVSTSLSGQGGQAAFDLQADSEFELFLLHEETSIDVDPKLWAGSNESLETASPEFRIQVHDICPSCDLTFILYYHKAKSRHNPVEAARLTVRLAGTFMPPDEAVLETTKVTLDEKPPEHVAILCIQYPDAGKISLSGWHHHNNYLSVHSINMPEIRLAVFEETQADALRARIHDFSSHISFQEVRHWLNRSCDACGQQLCVIIADLTGSDFPWEMVELVPKAYLGAKAQVIRRVPTHYFEWLYLHVYEEYRFGEVLVYLDREEVTHAEQERLLLERFAVSYCQTLTDLEQRLSHPLTDIGLVYLGCRGIITYNNPRAQADAASLSSSARRPIELALQGMERLEGARPIFFVNASHSARLVRDAEGLFGLPEITLDRVASGYIGTLGPVESTHAINLAGYILETVQSAPAVGIQPAEILRQLRAEAARKLEENETSENLRAFVNAFLYVYYGNPLARLRLADS